MIPVFEGMKRVLHALDRAAIAIGMDNSYQWKITAPINYWVVCGGLREEITT
jgi:ABC-type proline/glycine betaine transport system permease subunit